MAWRSPLEQRLLWQRRRRIAVALLIAYLIAALLDPVVFRVLYVGEGGAQHLEGRDWYRAFRVVGTLWVWIPLAAAIGLQGSMHAAWRLLAAPALGGLVAEVVKLLVGRQRPIHNGVGDGVYVYYGWLERFTRGVEGGGNYGMPSSHAAVAFAGAFALAGLYPRTAPVGIALACGCALTRLITGAHFLTDVLVGMLIGLWAARLLGPRDPRPAWPG